MYMLNYWVSMLLYNEETVTIPNTVQTGGNHLLEDVEPKIRYRETERVEFPRAVATESDQHVPMGSSMRDSPLTRETYAGHEGTGYSCPIARRR